jgi:hypothetical protein
MITETRVGPGLEGRLDAGAHTKTNIMEQQVQAESGTRDRGERPRASGSSRRSEQPNSNATDSKGRGEHDLEGRSVRRG